MTALFRKDALAVEHARVGEAPALGRTSSERDGRTWAYAVGGDGDKVADKADEVTRTLARARSAMDDLRVETQQTAAQHERMAAWYTEHDDQAAARMESRTAAVQRQLLADIDAAFEALEAAVYAALELDP